MENYLTTTIPGFTTKDILTPRSIVAFNKTYLSSSLPYKLIVGGDQFTDLTNIFRHKYKIELFGNAVILV